MKALKIILLFIVLLIFISCGKLPIQELLNQASDGYSVNVLTTEGSPPPDPRDIIDIEILCHRFDDTIDKYDGSIVETRGVKIYIVGGCKRLEWYPVYK